jgi:hypothetical protein
MINKKDNNMLNKIVGVKVVHLIIALMVSSFVNSASSIEYQSDKWEEIEELKTLITVKNSDVRVKDIKEFKKMKDFLKYRNSKISTEHILKRYKDIDGEDIECIDIHHQPALKRKGMENHVIQLQPPFLFESNGSEFDPDNYDDPEEGLDKPTHMIKLNSLCNIGSIPLKKLKIKHLTRFSTLADFKRKKLKGASEDTIEAPALTGPTDLHQYAVIGKTVNNWGINSKISAFNPYTESSTEFSLSQIWAVGGSGSNTETVEVGLQRYKQRNGDNYPRIFIYFTPDNYGSGGCYDLDCSGFVQIDNSISIGSRLSTYSQIGGSQHEMQMALVRERTQGNWWLQISGKWIGYWPNSLFDSTGLKDKSTRVSAGGEIINKNTTRHTGTDMGSGLFASEGWTKAAYQREIMYVNTSNQYTHMTSPYISETDSNCYDINFIAGTGNWKSYFYMGGTGYNTNCQ